MKPVKNYFSKSRIETFSDGVFAIIVTLLVLEIKVPHIELHNDNNELFKALVGLFPKFASWIISFFTVCVIWVSHHRLFKMFGNIDHGLFWFNALLLLNISFIPFPTATLGDYPLNQTAIFFYGIVMACNGIIFILMRTYVAKKVNILRPEVNKDKFKKGTIYVIFFGPLAYLSGAFLSYLHPYFSFIIYFLIAVYFILPHSTEDIEISSENN
jgi:uncharacterized membrane protein